MDSGTVNFNGSGTLKIADSDTFAGQVAGLPDATEIIELMDIDFAQATLGSRAT